MTSKDQEQDSQIRENAERITRNEEAIKRQTQALEQIRDHYYPPPERWWKKAFSFLAKVLCVIVAYLGIAETIDWLWNVREADALASRFARVGDRLCDIEGDFPGALSCYEKAHSLNPKESEYVMAISFLKGLSLASAYLDINRPLTDEERAKVSAMLADALVLKELQPKNPIPYVIMAQAHVLNGEKDAAVAAVEKAVAHAPNQASVHVSACAIHHCVGNKAEARAHLTEAERIDASLPFVELWRGILAFWDDHDIPAARAHFEEIARRMPRAAILQQDLGQALLAGDKPDVKRARAAFKHAVALNAKQTNAMLGIAETYERENESVLAQLWLDRAIATDAHCLPAFVARARLRGKSGAWWTALADLSAAIRIDSFRADLYRLRAEAYDRIGDAEKANEDRKIARALEKNRE